MRNIFQSVPHPVTETPPPVEKDITAHPRKSSFAAMRELSEKFFDAGIETENVWEYLKAEFDVKTRSKLTPKQWAMIAAKLQALTRCDVMFQVFIDGIPDTYFRMRVFTDNPNVCIHRPRVDRQHLPEAWDIDFQAFANASGTGITTQQGKRTTYYQPNKKRTEPKRTEPKRTEPKPLIAWDANAHGQVLNVFGDVVETRTA